MNDNKLSATIILIVSVAFAATAASGESPAEYLQFPAYVIGLGILAAAFVESEGNLRNLVRADWIAIVALYGLTLTEFLFKQPEYNERAIMMEAERALWLFSIGFVSLIVGRHLFLGRASSRGFHISELSPRLILLAFWIVIPLGYSAELLAVNFNVIELLDAQMGPRFSQPWSRGKIGGVYSLLYELGLFKYAIPAIAGVLTNYRKQIGWINFCLVMFAMLFTLFFGFCSGTRNVFAAYLAGYAGTYLLTLPRLSLAKASVVGAVCTVVFVGGSYLMLEFRQMGLKRFWQNRDRVETRDTFYVDYNMWAIGKLGRLFPEPYPHLGGELYWHAITKPIPRVMWPDKPTELSISIEGALEVEGLTIATTFIGESYMAFGELGVICTGLGLGFLCGWWNFIGSRMPGGYGQLVYASGFAAIAIAMRSLMFFTTNMLPTIGLVAVGMLLKQNINQRRQQQAPSQTLRTRRQRQPLRR